MTIQTTASGGMAYTLTFTGQKEFVGIDDTLSSVTRDLDMIEQRRSEVLRIMKLGLIRYVSRIPQADGIRVSYTRHVEPVEVVDKWDSWVFGLNVNGSIAGDESSRYVSVSGQVTADRVTQEWKFDFGASMYYSVDRFEVDEYKNKSIARRSDARGVIVKSLDNNWSVGGFASTSKSLFYNIDFSVDIAPAVEFNVFPYSESMHRDFRLFYKIGYRQNDCLDRNKEHREPPVLGGCQDSSRWSEG